MKALTLWEPWATCIAMKWKQYETRSRATSFRGPIAIHAAKRPISQHHLDDILNSIPLGYKKSFPKEFNYGCIVAIADLVDCIKMNEEIIKNISSMEKALGDWRVGRYAYKLSNIRTIKHPVEVKGKQGLWNWKFDGEIDDVD